MIKNLRRIPVPWVFILAYLVGFALQYIFPLSIYTNIASHSVKTIGIVLLSLGALLAAWSLIIFHRARTTTPSESAKRIITHGPYRLSRNPMYISLTIVYIGAAMFLLHSWPILILILMLMYVNYVLIPLEENALKKDFKDEYEEYCKRVKRWI